MNAHALKRRGFNLGKIEERECLDTLANWHLGQPVLLKDICAADLNKHREDIFQSSVLYTSILNTQEADSIFEHSPYQDRIAKNFEAIGSSINEGDKQEIETLLFDAINPNEIIAEDLWIKISWLSFYEQDASMRFRFSFGVDLAEDVAADQNRQYYAALLSDAVFPESRIITQNQALTTALQELLNCDSIKFVERIIYFNSPQGGAYLHHDLERGHAGVVYAQLSGVTYWLALSRQHLIDEIVEYIERCTEQNNWPSSLNRDQQLELITFSRNIDVLVAAMESFSDDTLIHLINEVKPFVQRLVGNGHGRVVRPGDVLLLPQKNDSSCCWHSVFCLGEEPGQALSFAIRGT